MSELQGRAKSILVVQHSDQLSGQFNIRTLLDIVLSWPVRRHSLIHTLVRQDAQRCEFTVNRELVTSALYELN